MDSGIKYACDISGANNPIKDNTIGNTQQNKCGNMDAMTPILIALFFIWFVLLWRPQQNSNLHLILRRDLFYPVELWGQIAPILHL